MNHKHIVPFIVTVLCIIFILLCIAMATTANAAYSVRTQRQDDLHTDAENLRALGYKDDSDEIKALQAAWWEEQETLDIVARVVQGEAGGCPWLHQLAVAQVVVNRINSPLFPNTAREVVAAPMQYTTLYLRDFDKTSEQCYLAAKYALDGNSGVPTDIIWQAEFVQGKEIWWTSKVDTGWYSSTTYFCR